MDGWVGRVRRGGCNHLQQQRLLVVVGVRLPSHRRRVCERHAQRSVVGLDAVRVGLLARRRVDGGGAGGVGEPIGLGDPFEVSLGRAAWWRSSAAGESSFVGGRLPAEVTPPASRQHRRPWWASALPPSVPVCGEQPQALRMHSRRSPWRSAAAPPPPAHPPPSPHHPPRRPLWPCGCAATRPSPRRAASTAAGAGSGSARRALSWRPAVAHSRPHGTRAQCRTAGGGRRGGSAAAARAR